MDRGIIEESLLTKDIEQIEMYAEEENLNLNKIYSVCQEASSTYISSNSNMLNSSLSNMTNDAKKLLKKRNEYANTLRRVIERYHMLTETTKRKFEDFKL